VTQPAIVPVRTVSLHPDRSPRHVGTGKDIMAKKMLIDATHPEPFTHIETRVVVADGSRVEEFDFESLNKRQLAGNIYLAKVTRVEPSLQAAFVDYGGNRHGFLAFSEIHPDYYQIPVADREALLAEERALRRGQARAEDESAKPKSSATAAGRVAGRGQDPPRPKAESAAKDAVTTGEVSLPGMDVVDLEDAETIDGAVEGFAPADRSDAPADPGTDDETALDEETAVMEGRGR
jgi:ribonuclease E